MYRKRIEPKFGASDVTLDVDDAAVHVPINALLPGAAAVAGAAAVP